MARFMAGIRCAFNVQADLVNGGNAMPNATALGQMMVVERVALFAVSFFESFRSRITSPPAEDRLQGLPGPASGRAPCPSTPQNGVNGCIFTLGIRLPGSEKGWRPGSEGLGRGSLPEGRATLPRPLQSFSDFLAGQLSTKAPSRRDPRG